MNLSTIKQDLLKIVFRVLWGINTLQVYALHRFFGLANHDKMIKKIISKIVKRLYKLLQKNGQFTWDETYENSCLKMKEK